MQMDISSEYNIISFKFAQPSILISEVVLMPLVLNRMTNISSAVLRYETVNHTRQPVFVYLKTVVKYICLLTNK